MRNRVYLEDLQDDNYLDLIREGFERLEVSSYIRTSDTVCIKPNLTFPVFREGVMTNPACVEAIALALKDYTSHIIIVESDSGGYNRFNISDVQEKIGLTAFARKEGIRIVNLSEQPMKNIRTRSRGRNIAIPFPELLDETDVMISAAVPKIHMNTLVSMTVKNLWGCIPIPRERLKLHPYLDKVLYEIVGRFKKTIGIIDGRYGLNRSGPMKGDPVDLNWVMMTDDFYAADAMCCRLMRIPPEKVRFLTRLVREGKSIPSERDLIIRDDWEEFRKEKFYLERALTDYPGLFAFNSAFLSWLAYFSPFADILHRILYLFREPFYDYDAPSETED